MLDRSGARRKDSRCLKTLEITRAFLSSVAAPDQAGRKVVLGT